MPSDANSDVTQFSYPHLVGWVPVITKHAIQLAVSKKNLKTNIFLIEDSNLYLMHIR